MFARGGFIDIVRGKTCIVSKPARTTRPYYPPLRNVTSIKPIGIIQVVDTRLHLSISRFVGYKYPRGYRNNLHSATTTPIPEMLPRHQHQGGDLWEH